MAPAMKPRGACRAAAALDVFAPRRGIEEHGDEAEAEHGQEGHVQFGRHRLKNQHGIAATQTAPFQQGRTPGGGPIQLGERGDPLRPQGRVDDGDVVGAIGGPSGEDLGDVHGRASSERAKRV